MGTLKALVGVGVVTGVVVYAYFRSLGTKIDSRLPEHKNDTPQLA